jgi:hypothetical protein
VSILAAIAALTTTGALMASDREKRKAMSRMVLRGPIREHRINLKYSVWSEDTGTFADHLDDPRGFFEDMLWAFSSPPGAGHRTTIHSSPKKESRNGTITIADGLVTVEMYENWDSVDWPDWAYELLTGTPRGELLLDVIRDNLVQWHMHSELASDGDGDPSVYADAVFFNARLPEERRRPGWKSEEAIEGLPKLLKAPERP